MYSNVLARTTFRVWCMLVSLPLCIWHCPVFCCIYSIWYCPMHFGGLHVFFWSFVVHCLWTDSVERFHISAFLLFVLAQNILEAEGPWFESFLFVSLPENIQPLYTFKGKVSVFVWFSYMFLCTLQNALLVYVCEMLIDIIKHSFLAKFNDIKPIAYSEFLEDLCKQVWAVLLSPFLYLLIWYFLGYLVHVKETIYFSLRLWICELRMGRRTSHLFLWHRLVL